MKKLLLAAVLAAAVTAPAVARPGANDPSTPGRDAGQGAVRFWDRVGEEQCFGLARAYYAEYFKSLGQNLGDSSGVGSGDVPENNQAWTEMWCEGDPW